MSASPEMMNTVVRNRVADSLQYWESALDYVNYTALDLEALKHLVEEYSKSAIEWYETFKQQRVINFTPSVQVSYFGVPVAGEIALTMVMRSLVHNLHKTFDSLAQFVNAVALADSKSRIDTEGVSIRKVERALANDGGFTDLASALQDVIADQDRFQYVVDLDNTLKHIIAVDPDLKWYFLQNTLEAYLPGFRKSDNWGTRTYSRKPLFSTAEELVRYAANTLKVFEGLVTTGCGVQWHPRVLERYQDLSYYLQYEELEGKNNITGAVQYLTVTSNPSKGETLRVMSVTATEAVDTTYFSVQNCLANSLVLRNENRVPIAVAKAVPVAQTEELELLTYREYCVTEVGPIDPNEFGRILGEPKTVRGRMERASGSFPANEFPAWLLTGDTSES